MVSQQNGFSSPFVSDSDITYTLKLDDGNWFEIRPRISVGAQEAIEREIAQISSVSSGGKDEVITAKYTMARVAILNYYIKSWSYTDRVVDRDNCLALDRDIADLLLEKISENAVPLVKKKKLKLTRQQ